MMTIDISFSEEIYTVSRLNREARLLLEGHFPPLWVEGEISNFSAPSSGHWYFSLKDANSQIRCAMFRPQNRKLNFIPKDGMQVIIKARVTLYEGRGEFQVLVEHLEEAGVGKLQKEFEALKKKLHAAGLFDTSHKKIIPSFPKCIGVITSATGAALRDILSVLKRRSAYVPIIIYPSLVQGELASANIVAAIQTANRRKECDVLIVGRGGGSLEDLWPFNEENVAYAIYHSDIPIISAVGHEIDFTIADFVADLRAATPSAAAELAVADKEELLDILLSHQQRLLQSIKQKINHFQQNLIWINKHLYQHHPKRQLADKIQQLDFYELALKRLQTKMLQQYEAKLQTLSAKLTAFTPLHLIRDSHHQINLFHQHLQNGMKKILQQNGQHLANLAGRLDALSPLATLQRGYAIAMQADNHVIRRASEVNMGDQIDVQLMEGRLKCVVKKKL